MKFRIHPKHHNAIKVIASLALFCVGAFFGLSSSQASTLTFNNSLTGIFPGIDINYSSIAFQYGGNNAPGMIFWTSKTTLSIPETITIAGNSAQSGQCTERLNGIYYNSQRGSTIRPLDNGTKLQLINTGYGDYNNLIISGGLYTNCTGNFIPSSNEIYGKIDHTFSGTQYHLVAGINYDFTGNSILGISFGHTLTTIAPGYMSGFVYDNYGGIGLIGGVGNGCVTNCRNTGASCTLNISNNPLHVNNNTQFTCAGTNTSGYILNIFKLSAGVPLQYQSSGTVRQIGSAFSTGDYAVTCSTLGGGQCAATQLWTVSSSGTCSSFAGNINIVTVPGSVIAGGTGAPNYYYARTTGGVDIQIRSTLPSSYVISSIGNILNTITGNYLFSYNPPFVNNINTGTIYLTTGDGQKQINALFTENGNACTYSSSPQWITLDLLPPTTATLLSPINGSGVCFMGNIMLSRTGAMDSGAGISNYNYKVYDNSAFSGALINAISTGATVSFNINLLGGTRGLTGTYYRSVQAIDRLNQTGGTSTGYFTIDTNTCSGNIPIYGLIPNIISAELNTEYTSSPFSIQNIIGPVFASISTGTLYVNGIAKTTTGNVNNGDVLNIKLRSSTGYSTTVNSVFTLGANQATFSITTKAQTATGTTTGTTTTGTTLSGCVFTTGQKDILNSVFDMIKDTYNANTTTLSDFLFTMQSMLQDNIGITNNCSLAYLSDITNQYIADNIQQNTDESNHEAPNCKIYKVNFDSAKQAYSSSTLKKKTYFAAREALTRYIDIYNPGDCRHNIYQDLPSFDNTDFSGTYIAPNGKIYTIKETQRSGTTMFYSPDFIKIKYYENRDDLTTYIDNNNAIQEIWDHEVDNSFDPVVYATANNKEYRIYKTDKGYMSYKLMKVMYFDSLAEIETYISKNNPQK